MKKKKQKWLGEDLAKELDLISAKKNKPLVDLTIDDIAPEFFREKKKKNEDFRLFK